MTESIKLGLKQNGKHETGHQKNGINNSNSSNTAKLIDNQSKSNGISTKSDTVNSNPNKISSPFTITLHIDLIAWSCFLIAFILRIYLIGYPPNIV